MNEFPVNDEYIVSTMKQFKLIDMRESYSSLIKEAETTNMGYREFLVKLLLSEKEGKRLRQQEQLIKQAHFDMVKNLDDIDYGFNPSLDQSKIEYLAHLDFIKEHENVIIIGPPGVRKSMIATGIGRNACKAGYKVLFVNAKELVNRMYDEM